MLCWIADSRQGEGVKVEATPLDKALKTLLKGSSFDKGRKENER